MNKDEDSYAPLFIYELFFAVFLATLSLSPSFFISDFILKNYHIKINEFWSVVTIMTNTIIILFLILKYFNRHQSVWQSLKDHYLSFLLVIIFSSMIFWLMIPKPVFIIIGSCFIALVWFFYRTPSSKSTRSIKGADLITQPKKTIRSVTKRAIKSNAVSFASTLIPLSSESLHFVALGTTGTGKSTAIKELIHTSKIRGDRHIICDPDGSYFNDFGSHGDSVLNPLRENSVQWDYLAEIKNSTDHRLLASMLIPESSRDDEWRGYARQLLASASEKWVSLDLGSSDKFFEFLGTSSQVEMAALCDGTYARRFFEDGNERMLGSILSTLAPFIEPFRLVSQNQGGKFSIREWIKHGSGSLFIPYKANELASLKTLISTWFGLAIYESLSLDANADNPKTWFVVDEVDAFGRIHGLKDALARLRKYGGRVVLGFQSISQLRQVYGDAEANTIIENCGNKLILRCDASERGGTAEFASKLIGEHDYFSVQSSSSHSNKGDTNTSYSKQQKREMLVMASQIMQLPNLSGYLRIAGESVWRKVSFQFFEKS